MISIKGLMFKVGRQLKGLQGLWTTSYKTPKVTTSAQRIKAAGVKALKQRKLM